MWERRGRLFSEAAAIYTNATMAGKKLQTF